MKTNLGCWDFDQSEHIYCNLTAFYKTHPSNNNWLTADMLQTHNNTVWPPGASTVIQGPVQAPIRNKNTYMLAPV